MAQIQVGLSTVDEDMTHRRTPERSVISTVLELQTATTRLSTTVAMQTDKEVWKTVSLVPTPTPAPNNAIATESPGSSIVEDDNKVEMEDLWCTSLSNDEEQETTEVSEVYEDSLYDPGSVLVYYQYAPSSGSDQVLDETSEYMVCTDISCPSGTKLITHYVCR